MLRWLLLFLSLGCAVLGSLTSVPAPTLTGWKCAVLAGEYGQVLVAAPLAILIVVGLRWRRKGCGAAESATIAFGLLGLLGFLRPSLAAWRISRALPERMIRAFGPAARIEAPVFRMYAADAPLHGLVETYLYSGGEAPLALDFYRARTSAPAVPCVVLIHGGGWDGGRRDEFPALDQVLARRGYAVAAIDYRLAPRYPWPAPKDDVRHALAYLKAHASHLGIDPERFALLGRSAGGQIAVASAYELDDPSIRGVAAFYAPHDLRFAWGLGTADDLLNSPRLLRQLTGGTPEETPRVWDAASGILQVKPGVPPTLLVHGSLDTLVWHQQSERLEAVLAKEKVPHLLVLLPWATHAFDYTPNGPGGQLSTAALTGFLRAVMR